MEQLKGHKKHFLLPEASLSPPTHLLANPPRHSHSVPVPAHFKISKVIQSNTDQLLIRCKYDRIKYLIQIAYYITLIFQRRGGERLNVALGFGLNLGCL